MAAALTILLIGSLLRGAVCEEFKALMPQTIEVLNGSCVTIPCSFTIKDIHIPALDNTCAAIWKQLDDNEVVFDSRNTQSAGGELTGNLKNKDCTTTLNNSKPAYRQKYYFRLECNNLKYDFRQPVDQKLDISVNDDPPKPTLTPSSLKQEGGTLVSLTCSAPAPCLSHPPNLTWTPGLGDSQETLKENEDKTKVRISVMNFTASHLHHRKEISCTATYHKQDGSNVSSVSTGLTADITFAPQFLPSSVCTKAATQLNCSCETVGNPSPTLQWYLDGLPVHHSDRVVISSENLNDTYLKSIISVDQAQQRNLSTLLCRSSNSLGSASQRFCINSLESQTSAQNQVMLSVFITTVVALLVLVCALLFVIRAQRIHHNFLKSQCTGDTSTVTMSHLLSEEGNELPNTAEEDIYVNANELRQADVSHPPNISEPNSINLPSSGPNLARGASKGSEKKNEEGNDVIYSRVDWKPKSKKKKGEDCVDMHLPGTSYLEEERCTVGGMGRGYVNNALEMGSLYDNVEPRNVEKDVECDYAQVKFKDKSKMNK